MTSSRPITFNDLITFMVFKPQHPLKPHAHKITIKIFNIKHGGSPRFWFFFAKSTVIWRYFYQVETCNHVDVKACWDFTHELRSTVKNKSWGRVFFICFVFWSLVLNIHILQCHVSWKGSYLDSSESAFCGLEMLPLTVGLLEDYPSRQSHHPLEERRNWN